MLKSIISWFLIAQRPSDVGAAEFVQCCSAYSKIYKSPRGAQRTDPTPANRPKKRGTLNPALPLWGRSESILCKLIGCARRDQTIIRWHLYAYTLFHADAMRARDVTTSFSHINFIVCGSFVFFSCHTSAFLCLFFPEKRCRPDPARTAHLSISASASTKIYCYWNCLFYSAACDNDKLAGACALHAWNFVIC